MTYQTLIKNIASSQVTARSKDKLYFIFVYPCQYLENSLIVLYDGKYTSVFGVN